MKDTEFGHATVEDTTNSVPLASDLAFSYTFSFTIVFCMMVMVKALRAVSILFLWFLAIATLQISYCHGKSDAFCIKSERNALLVFKNDLEDPSNRLSSWSDEEDCCRWAGVVCNNVTGHVQELHIVPSPLDEASYEASKRSKLGGKINPSLLELKYLSYLNLSNNNFEGIQIPKFLGSMTALRYLDLYDNKFVGMIPHQLGNLSSLRYLRISGDYSGTTYADDLRWLSGLSQLEHLGLYHVNLSQASDWLQRINMLPSLSELHLYYCHLDHLPSLPHINFTSLVALDISGNNFHTSVPKWVFNLGSLTYLDLSSNSFNGPIPSGLQNITRLRHLDLSYYYNFDSAAIPTWLFNFSHLEFLRLSGLYLQGLIPNAIGNLTSITTLGLSDNELNGTIPRSLGNLCNLRKLDFSYNKLGEEISQLLKSLSACVSHNLENLYLDTNKLYGELTDQIGLFKKLVDLSFSNNAVSGPIPESLGSISSLIYIDVGYNQLGGVVSEAHFTNLTNLKRFDASGNLLVLKVDPDWIPPFKLQYLFITSWQLGPQFPKWLNSQKDLELLDLSYTGISDNIPTWFWNLRADIYYLNLSHNQIYGEIPHIIKVGSNYSYPYALFDLSSNRFSGPLPYLSSNLRTELDLSNNSFSGNISHFLCNRMDEPNNVTILHLEENLLSGEIPNCSMNWPWLRFLNLENNNLTGNIPSSIGYLKGLNSLHLRNNSLSGKLPLALQNCRELLALDLGENEFVGSIPAWIGSSLSNLEILNLRLNNFNGEIPSELCRLSSLHILDLAFNNLSGSIPRCVNKLEAMVTERSSLDDFRYSNFSVGMIEYAFVMAKGREVEYDTILSLVASFDLSSNNLSGELPEELTSLIGLLALNLSNNHLTGRIPGGISDMVSLESLDLSQNQLSGAIPPSLSSLTFLSYLNLSYNNLSGLIPTSTQLQSLPDSSFVGNYLCGPPLTVNCSVNPEAEEPPNDEDGGDKMEWFYLSMTLGFVVGFWGVWGPILFKRSWRYAYFLFLDLMWYKFCDFFSKHC